MIALLHRGSFSAMLAGLALILQPWWHRGFAAGFFVTLAATVAYIITSHLIRPEAP